MLSVRSIVTVEVNSKKYEFTCQPDSSLPDAIEASSQINAFLLGRQEQGKAAQAAAEAAEQPAVEAVAEPEQS